MEAMKATETDYWQGQKTFSIMECILKSDFPLSLSDSIKSTPV